MDSRLALEHEEKRKNQNVARIVAGAAFVSVIAATWLMLIGTVERNSDFRFAMFVFFIVGFGAMVAASNTAPRKKDESDEANK